MATQTQLDNLSIITIFSCRSEGARNAGFFGASAQRGHEERSVVDWRGRRLGTFDQNPADFRWFHPRTRCDSREGAGDTTKSALARMEWRSCPK